MKRQASEDTTPDERPTHSDEGVLTHLGHAEPEQESKKIKPGGVSEAEIEQQVQNPSFRAFALKMRTSLFDLRSVPGQEPSYVPIPDDCPAELKQALTGLGFDKLYSHQLECRNLVRAGKDVIITTPTSSGKSLSFNLPIIEQLLNEPNATALYLYPLNALMKDQEEKLNILNSALRRRLDVVTLTGDMPTDLRARLLSSGTPRIVLTNPDLVHWQIYRGAKMADGRGWRVIMQRLRFVVLDEAHTYNGVFGAHVANVMRRLAASILECGGDPCRVQYILASATVRNGSEMACRLIGRETIAHITGSGAPLSRKTVITMTPTEDMYRQAATVIKMWIDLNLRGLVFCDAVASVTGIVDYMYSTKEFQRCVSKVRSFYSSRVDMDKKKLLAMLKSGELMVLVCTSALEAGVDIAQLDAVLLHRFPGSRMSFWQRVGRAGRSKEGLAVFLPKKSDSMDSYYAYHPEQMMNKLVESVVFNPDYPGVLKRHLLCAAAEKMLPDDAERLADLYGPRAGELVDQMLQANELIPDSFCGYRHNTAPDLPHKALSLRGGSHMQIDCKIINNKGEFTQHESVAIQQAFFRYFPGAVVASNTVGGKFERFLVKSLDTKAKRAILVPRATPLYDKERLPNVLSHIELTTEWGRKTFTLDGHKNAELQLRYGYGVVETRLTGYGEFRKKRPGSDMLSSREPENFVPYTPPIDYKHQAPVLHISFTPAALQLLQKHAILANIPSTLGAPVEVLMHTILHQLMTVVPLYMLAPAVVEMPPRAALGEGYLADSCDGGSGVCESIFENFEEYWKKAAEMSLNCAECGGKEGCPTCLFVRPGTCSKWNRGLCAKLGCAHIHIQPAAGQAPAEPVQKEFPASQGTSCSESVVVDPVDASFSGSVLEGEDEAGVDVDAVPSSPIFNLTG